MKFVAKVKDVKASTDYSGEMVEVNLDVEPGPDGARVYAGLRLPKGHPLVMSYMAAWQGERPVELVIEL